MLRHFSGYLQWWGFHNFSGQPVLIFDLFHYKAHSAFNFPESLIQKTISHILKSSRPHWVHCLTKNGERWRRCVRKGEKGSEWRQFHPKQRTSLCTTLQQAVNFYSPALTPRRNSQCRWGQRQGMRKKGRGTMLPLFIILLPLFKTVSLYPDTEKWFSCRNWKCHLSINCLQTLNPLKGWQKKISLLANNHVNRTCGDCQVYDQSRKKNLDFAEQNCQMIKILSRNSF